ncbi:uncharacterized protein LOC115628097 isoform X2 [Scaptodrosophila lebanonensis]|uniref:Uncharacterized protein LOC115628097 isoform X2 n=1 Tax=Drosophila lebanonensis TaxID=7225 RepID=A0A6J2TV23_DROLE|nr:uncharacterized protein LOC115628097 isoform X2 [Scaptodrosophila lebanonensis]
MNISRFRSCQYGYILLKNVLKTSAPQRQSHVVSYRVPPPPHSKATKVGAVAVGGAMWWIVNIYRRLFPTG